MMGGQRMLVSPADGCLANAAPAWMDQHAMQEGVCLDCS